MAAKSPVRWSWILPLAGFLLAALAAARETLSS
jgi:hypothetical protein